MTIDNTLILRDRAAIEDASMAQLVATYNALTGRTPDGEGVRRCISKFENREIGKRRVDAAMMAAADADAHLGVPKGSEGQVLTQEELNVKAEDKGQPAPNMNPDDTAPVLPAGSLGAQLQGQANAAKPITPRARKDATPKAPAGPKRVKADFVVRAPAEKATTKVRPDSNRGRLLAALDTFMAVEGTKTVSIEQLTKHCEMDMRGAAQQLVQMGHLVFTDAEGTVIEGPVAAAPAPAPAPAPADVDATEEQREEAREENADAVEGEREGGPAADSEEAPTVA